MAKNVKKSNHNMSKRTKIGAGMTTVPLITGPLDAINHKFDTDEEITSHIREMERKKDFIRQQIPRAEKEYEEERNELLKARERDRQKQQIRQQEAHQRQMQREQIENKAIERASDSAASLIKNSIIALWELIKKTFHFGDKVTDKAGTVVDKVTGKAGTVVDRVANGPTWVTILKWFLTILTFLLILALIGLILGYTISAVTKPSQEKNTDSTQSGSDKSEKCKKFLGNSYTVNIDNGGWEWAGTKTIRTVLQQGENTIKPNFDAIKQLTKKTFDEIISNPAAYLGESIQYWYDLFVNSEPLKSLLIYAKYLSTYAVFNLQSLSGGTVYDTYTNTTQRDVISDGRSDNINFFDSSIFPKQLLRDKNIVTKDSVINLSKPIDIEWNLPELEYDGLDISKLPPSLVAKKDANGISLEDKKTIVIPWITKNNHYVLSCEDAYFKNNMNEKANLFVDIDDTTCTYNIQSTPHIFKEDKTQYKYTNDLSTFV